MAEGIRKKEGKIKLVSLPLAGKTESQRLCLACKKKNMRQSKSENAFPSQSQGNEEKKTTFLQKSACCQKLIIHQRQKRP
jgi:hypothetical protein